jgi:hypothetical protein
MDRRRSSEKSNRSSKKDCECGDLIEGLGFRDWVLIPKTLAMQSFVFNKNLRMKDNVKLSEEQIIMLEMSQNDIACGNLISQSELR